MPLLAAGLAAPVAGTAWWMLIDQIPLTQALATPFPYVLIAISLFVATPVYTAASSWIDGRLWRLLLLATIGASPFAAYAVVYFLTPRDIFAAFLIFSTAWVSALAFGLVLRMARTRDSG
jgi:hypothetical protein